jgi:hypothetical protein
MQKECKSSAFEFDKAEAWGLPSDPDVADGALAFAE